MSSLESCEVCSAPASKQCAKCGAVHYCSRECQVAGWPSHKLTCSSLVEVKAIAGSGLGLFARQACEVGACLVREKPLFVNRSSGWASASTQEEAESMAFQQASAQIPLLPATLKAAVMDLADVHSSPDGSKTPAGIARTNMIPLAGTGDGALFALSARINHSCLPNARWCWREDKGCLHIFAMRPLKPGEQITVAYSKRYARRTARLKLLQEQFRFVCTCSLCSEPVEGTCDRMEQIQDAIDRMPDACARGDMAAALELSERTMKLLVEGGLDTPVAMGTCHYEAYQLARALGDRPKAIRHLVQAHELTKLSDGSDSPLALQYGRLVESLA